MSDTAAGAEFEKEPSKASKTAPGSILDAAIGATVTKGVEPDRAEQLVGTLVDRALDGHVTFDKNMSRTLKRAIERIDERISEQLAEVMHHEKFRTLEGSWRGLQYLIKNGNLGSDTGVKVDLLNVGKRELLKDLEKSDDFDQSTIWKKVYENEFGTPGGQPYAALVGNYEFGRGPEDIDLLKKMSGVAAAAFCPFLSAASPQLFGFKSFEDLATPRDLKAIFKEGSEYVSWRSFRQMEDSRFVGLTMPRVLARLPYGEATKKIDEFAYEEASRDANGDLMEIPNDDYCWMNAAFVLATKLTDAFAKTGFCTMIRGHDSGGRVENLPVHTFKTDEGDTTSNCPTEVAITDRRSKELDDSGFLPLSHYKDTDYSVFFGGQTCQEPQEYVEANAAANAKICARLPYVLASSRFAHYLKVIGRDKIGSLATAADVADHLQRWIGQYVLDDASGSEDAKARHPLREAKIEVVEDLRNPGSYDAVAHLRPWLGMEELNASVRMVARIPQKKQ